MGGPGPRKAQPQRGGGTAFRLTPREAEVLALLEQGYTPLGIAEALGIARSTAAGLVREVREKVQAAGE